MASMPSEMVSDSDRSLICLYHDQTRT